MEITGTWISDNNQRLTITNYSAHVISGYINISENELLDTGFNGIILRFDNKEIIFCSNMDLQNNEYAIMAGNISLKSKVLELKIFKGLEKKKESELEIITNSFKYSKS